MEGIPFGSAKLLDTGQVLLDCVLYVDRFMIAILPKMFTVFIFPGKVSSALLCQHPAGAQGGDGSHADQAEGAVEGFCLNLRHRNMAGVVSSLPAAAVVC